MRCHRDHAALSAADSPEWQALKFLGIQEDTDDDGNPAPLELRDCTCGSTLARPVKLCGYWLRQHARELRENSDVAFGFRPSFSDAQLQAIEEAEARAYEADPPCGDCEGCSSEDCGQDRDAQIGAAL